MLKKGIVFFLSTKQQITLQCLKSSQCFLWYGVHVHHLTSYMYSIKIHMLTVWIMYTPVLSTVLYSTGVFTCIAVCVSSVLYQCESTVLFRL